MFVEVSDQVLKIIVMYKTQIKESEPMSLANAIAVKEYVGLLSNPFGNGTKTTFSESSNYENI